MAKSPNAFSSVSFMRKFVLPTLCALSLGKGHLTINAKITSVSFDSLLF